jgi:hypothetical protein
MLSGQFHFAYSSSRQAHMTTKKELTLGELSSGAIAKPFVLNWAVRGEGRPVLATDAASDTASASRPVSEDTAILSTPVAEDTAI